MKGSDLLNPLRGITDLIYPPCCLVCGERTAPFCEVCSVALFNDPHKCCPCCAARVGPFAVTDGTCSACRAEKPAFTATVRLGVYQSPLRELVLRLKTSRYEFLAELLGECLAEQHLDRLRELAPDAIVPVPLYWWRRLCRGYNQSGAIARGIGHKLGVPCRSWWLVQINPTKPQKTLSKTQRRVNVRNAFYVTRQLTGLHVLLVDDVMTTGSTAMEAARVLARAGARVSVAVLARTVG